MWSKIQETVESPVQSKSKHKLRRSLVLASFILIGAMGVLWFTLGENNTDSNFDYYSNQTDTRDFIEHVNQTDIPQKIQLADGSTVMLGAKSSLRYLDNYDKDSTRNVYLRGEGFFDVVKNPYKPFIVHSNEVFVKVLGTSFRVAAPENGTNVVVAVKTGKVSVYAMKGSQDKKDGVILLPNQQVRYERKDQSFAKTLVEAPEILNTTIAENDFVFENTPIADVFRTLEKAYGIEIIFNDEIMKNCYLTVPLGRESMQEKLRIICDAVGANYEVIDANIVINSSGCE
jgi:ferric-dicitrate binding protein FerR (iron transport regulator)